MDIVRIESEDWPEGPRAQGVSDHPRHSQDVLVVVFGVHLGDAVFDEHVKHIKNRVSVHFVELRLYDEIVAFLDAELVDFEKVLVADRDVDVFVVRGVGLVEKEALPAEVEVPLVELAELLAVLPVLVDDHVLKGG